MKTRSRESDENLVIQKKQNRPTARSLRPTQPAYCDGHDVGRLAPSWRSWNLPTWDKSAYFDRASICFARSIASSIACWIGNPGLTPGRRCPTSLSHASCISF